MSYSILYDRFFLRVPSSEGGEDKFLPMALIGDNNVWEYPRGRNGAQRRSRDWTPLTLGSPDILKTKEFLLNEPFDRDRLCRERSKDYDPERFGWFEGVAMKGRSCAGTTLNMYKNFFHKGVEQAITLEQFAELLGGTLAISTGEYTRLSDEDEATYGHKGAGLEKLSYVTFETSKALEFFLNEEYSKYMDAKGVYVKFHLSSPYINNDGATKARKKLGFSKRKKTQRIQKEVDHAYEVRVYKVHQNEDGTTHEGYLGVLDSYRGGSFRFFHYEGRGKLFADPQKAQVVAGKMNARRKDYAFKVEEITPKGAGTRLFIWCDEPVEENQTQN